MLDLQSIDLKREVEELQRNDPGKERGTDIKFLVKYVKQKEGEQGFQKVKVELEKCGYQLPGIDKIGDLDWTPSSLPTIFMVASAKVFGWQEKDIVEWGRNAPTLSATVKLFIKYFLSLKETFERAVRAWRKFYTFGEFKIVKYDKKEKIVIARLSNFKKHPITCLYFQGTFSRLMEIATGSDKVTAEETKCEFRGDPYHEFVFKWE